MSSSLVRRPFIGQSGRKYMRIKELRSDATVHQRSVYLANSGDQPFILKRVSEYTYRKCQSIDSKFAGSRRLRQHIDENEDERTLVYEYLRGNLFHFMNAYSQNPPLAAIMQILWETGKALEEMHDKDMMHVDLKPDNILLNWDENALSVQEASASSVSKVTLSDLDTGMDMRGAWLVRPAKEYRALRFGNIRWRAPELQTGQGIGLFSDVFAFGLTVPLSEEDFDETTKSVGMLPEEVVLGMTIEYFGPLTPDFLKHTADEEWQHKLKTLEAVVVENGGVNPASRFDNWTVADFPHLTPDIKAMLSRMLKFTPSERPTIRQIMSDPCWTRFVQ